jgi:hypothetical protein
MTELEKIATSSIVTFLLGFFSAVFAEPIRLWWFRPRLFLDFKPDFGAGSNYVAMSPDRTQGATEMSKYVRMSAYNKTRSIAKNCRAFLTRIEKETDQDTFKALHNDPLPLPWAYLGTAPVDIPAGIAFHFDVVAVFDSKNLLVPQTYPKPLIWESHMKEPGCYKFHVVLTGDNIRPVGRALSIKWGGSFDSITTDSFK